MSTSIRALLEQNRNRLVSISELEIIISSRKNRNGNITSLESSIKIEEELYELDVKAIKTLREKIKI